MKFKQRICTSQADPKSPWGYKFFNVEIEAGSRKEARRIARGMDFGGFSEKVGRYTLGFTRKS